MEGKIKDIKEYPEQFYEYPYFRDKRDEGRYMARITTAVANELHELRKTNTKICTLLEELLKK